MTNRGQLLLDLYARCLRYQALPDAGGLLDQEERLMRELDAIHGEVQEARKRHARNEAREAEARNSAAMRRGGR